MITRRNLLAGIIAAAAPPAFVRRESLGGLWVPRRNLTQLAFTAKSIAAVDLASGAYTFSIWSKEPGGDWQVRQATSDEHGTATIRLSDTSLVMRPSIVANVIGAPRLKFELNSERQA